LKLTGLTAIVGAIALLCAGACSRPSATSPASAPQPAQASQPATAPQGAGGLSAEALPPQAAHATSTQAPALQTVTGPVVETMDASNYTYVRVKTAGGDVWAASAKFKVAVGERVVVSLEQPMQNFHSQTLNRDFPLIYFTSGIAREGEPLPAATMPGHPPMGGGQPAAATTVTEPIAPPEGGTTVAKVWTNKTALAGKTVTVRGRVVKYNGGILGKNWLHIQDGSGNAKDGTHDLTITTTDLVKVGDVVTAVGTVAVARDFGAGYAYPVMIEGAKVVVK
jgi:hypothetical protein